MLKIEDVSGCLVVVDDDFKKNYCLMIDSFKPMAIDEWNSLNDEGSEFLYSRYSLDDEERQLCNEKKAMPESFLEKYCVKRVISCPKNEFLCFLWHKNIPNTKWEIIKSIKESRLYRVKCTICGKHYFMDEQSFLCVRWRSCVGAKCLSHTVSDEVFDYNNLCNVNNSSNALQLLNTQLSSVEHISNPLSYYGGYSSLHVSYISDMHLECHKQVHLTYRSMKIFVRNIVKQLYATMDENSIILFVGDISSDFPSALSNVTIEFYTQFVKYKDFLMYKSKKKLLDDIQYNKKVIDAKKRKMELKIINLKNYINSLKSCLSLYLNFDSIVIYKKRYRKFEYESWVATIDAYKTLNSYVNKNISDKCDLLLDLIAQKLDLLTKFECKHNEYLSRYELLKSNFFNIENKYNKSIEELTVKDVYTEHYLLSDERQIFVVLGNHEYIGFNSINEAVENYKQFFVSLGIKLLHNDYFKFYVNDKCCVIFGGTGFAKYNSKYNADTLVCCDNFTRQDEFKETSLFEKEYAKARQLAFANNACFICVSHYPIQDCLECIDNDTIYFHGHNHQNFCCKNDKQVIYADNQIGYRNSNIKFKTMTTGFELNPYFSLDDGLYKTTIKDYLQFYRYIGESIGDGSLLYQRCQNDKASIYVIKRKGYYGFFVLNLNTGTAKCISIINGGKTKKITKSTDLQWLFDSFEVVLSKYLQTLLPLRLAQEQISNELKDLGFSGKIHGCIIDVDYYHHIMLNPVDGTMSYYYSPTFGIVQPISSFDKVILSIQKNDIGTFASNRNYKLLQKRFNEQKQNPTYLLGKINSYDTETVMEQRVNRSESMYIVSQKINTLQRLFSGHVLRDFDVNLIETQPLTINSVKKADKLIK